LVSLSSKQALVAILGIVYGAMFIGIVYLAVAATSADPTDETIYKEREAEAKR
jgi:hypothetical protein